MSSFLWLYRWLTLILIVFLQFIENHGILLNINVQNHIEASLFSCLLLNWILQHCNIFLRKLLYLLWYCESVEKCNGFRTDVFFLSWSCCIYKHHFLGVGHRYEGAMLCAHFEWRNYCICCNATKFIPVCNISLSLPISPAI